MKDITISINGESTAKEKKENIALQKKLKKIDHLKAQIERIKKGILKYQNLYTKEVLPEVEKLNTLLEEYVVKLFSKLSQKSFSQSQRYEIRQLILNEISSIRATGYSTYKLEEIERELFEMDCNDLSDEEEDIMNDMIKEMAREYGYDVDDEEFNFKEFIKENMDRDGSEKRDESQYKAFQEDAKEHKIKTTDKDFYKIYKRLAKKTHPDLVTDLEEKKKREQWMKQLSEAWTDRNYITLLRLQREIEGVVEDTISLEKTQYKNIIKQLNAELQALEEQKYVITSHDPNTAFFYQNFKSRSDKGLHKKIDQFKEQILENIAQTQRNVQMLKTQKSTKAYLKELYADPFYDESIFFDDDLFFDI